MNTSGENAAELEALRAELAARDAELQQLRAEFEEVQTRFDLILAATNDGVWNWHPNTGEVQFSSRWKGMLGFEADELPDTTDSFFGRVHPEDLPRVELAIDAHLSRREPYEVEFRMRSKGGVWRTIVARGQGEWDEDGQAIRMAGTHTDVTERRLQERERERAAALIAEQRDTINALGVPILQVWRGILCLPVIGAVHDERANSMISTLLERVTQSETQFVILDLTAAEFHPQTAQHLSRMNRALLLVGTRIIFCGISPKMALTLTDLGVDLGDAPTFRDLDNSLRACLFYMREMDE